MTGAPPVKIESAVMTTEQKNEFEIPDALNGYKIPGVYYFEYPGGAVPIAPPWTTWSGLVTMPPTSPYAARLLQKCGGIVMTKPFKKTGKDIWKEDHTFTYGKPGWIMGFWTAPDDWTEMAAGRESPEPFNPKIHTRIKT